MIFDARVIEEGKRWSAKFYADALAAVDLQVHTEDTDSGVVLDTEVDVLLDTETEVAGLGEVAVVRIRSHPHVCPNAPLPQLVLLDLQRTLENLLSLGTPDSNVNGNLFVPADTEGTDGVAGLGSNGGLTSELLENLGGTSKTVTRLSDRDVDNQLLDAKLLHRVDGGSLVGLG